MSLLFKLASVIAATASVTYLLWFVFCMSNNKDSFDSSDSCRSFLIRAELRFTLESSDLESDVPAATDKLGCLELLHTH